MKDQVHIRNAEAAQLARILARQTGRTIGEVVLDALRQYRPARRKLTSRKRVGQWRQQLDADCKYGVAGPETPVDALYDKATGLPA